MGKWLFAAVSVPKLCHEERPNAVLEHRVGLTTTLTQGVNAMAMPILRPESPGILLSRPRFAPRLRDCGPGRVWTCLGESKWIRLGLLRLAP